MATIERFPTRSSREPNATSPYHEDVLRFTQEVFGRPATVETQVDPELGFESFVVTVAASGAFEDLRARYDRWHRQLDSAAKELTSKYSLSLSSADDAS